MISVISPQQVGNEDPILRLDLTLSGSRDRRSALATIRAYRTIRRIHPLTVRNRTANTPWRMFADGPGAGWWARETATVDNTTTEQRLRIAESRRRVTAAHRELDAAERELALAERVGDPDVDE